MTDTPAMRGRGRPRLIDRERIIAAASLLDPTTLTMQSVADQLGVNRKALSYHVTDREELLRLVAEQSLSVGMPDRAPDSEDWRDTARWYARALRDSVIASGAVARHLTPGSASSLEALRPTEALVAALERAGFSPIQMIATTTLLAELALNSGRWAVMTGRPDVNPATLEVRATLEGPAGNDFTTLRRIAAAAQLRADEQFTFNLDAAIRGVDSLRLAGAI